MNSSRGSLNTNQSREFVIKKKALTGVGVKAGTSGKLKAQNEAVMALIGNKDPTSSRASFGNTSNSGMMRGSTPKKLAPIDQKDLMNESFTSLNSNNSKAERMFKAGM